ncbi:uncharacterized protein [Branchiostoma lanceolatum]|uniref:uncharacterized protein n=1 Tax=Branchiostoma lanceolatum TaxID=7740 RepID=UPI003456E287
MGRPSGAHLRAPFGRTSDEVGFRNLSRLFGKEECCQLCGKEKANLKHILSACTTALKQGRYTWRHNNALRVLAVALEEERRKTRVEESAKAQKKVISHICETTLRPDLVLWSEEAKAVIIVELTVPW